MKNQNIPNGRKILLDFIYDRMGAAIDWIYLIFGIVVNALAICLSIYNLITSEFNWAAIFIIIPVATFGLFGMYFLHKKNKRRSVGIFGTMLFTSFFAAANPRSTTIAIFCVTAIFSLLRWHIFLRNKNEEVI